jgi:MFS superfamily sulfate permease-like transporter
METGNGGKQLRMTLAEDVNFLNKGAIIKELARIPKGTLLAIDLSKCYSIDYDVREIIEDFIKAAGDRDISVNLKQPLAEANGKEEIYSKKLDKWVLALPTRNKALPV